MVSSLFLTLDYFADLQGRVDDDPCVYWEFYGSAVCGEYHFHTQTHTHIYRNAQHTHSNRHKNIMQTDRQTVG